MTNYKVVYSSDYLAHHGILGQKWGVRRFQNADGSLTPKGKMRYKVNEDGSISKKSGNERKSEKKESLSYNYKTGDRYMNSDRYKKASITNVYNYRKVLLGEKNANKLEYKADKYGTNSNKEAKKELVKKAVIGTVAVAALVNSKNIMAIGRNYISSAKNAIMVNNYMTELYRMNKGLNVIDKKGFTLGLDAVKRGRMYAGKILGR